jgi:hypothetical protein
MTWSRAFAEPFVLADGREIKTLYEAGQLELALPGRHRANGHWQGAMERLGSHRRDHQTAQATELRLFSISFLILCKLSRASLPLSFVNRKSGQRAGRLLIPAFSRALSTRDARQTTSLCPVLPTWRSPIRIGFERASRLSSGDIAACRPLTRRRYRRRPAQTRPARGVGDATS